MKKLTERDGADWYCETCAEAVPEPDWRYVADMRLQDFTDSHFVTAFRSAEGIFGISARDLHAMNQREQEEQLNSALYQTSMFVVKASVDAWQGVERLRIAIVRREDLNFTEETKVTNPQHSRDAQLLTFAETVQRD